ncbi:MAG TPA: hypothetical protein VNI01_12900, partial [Elusimicrobiota bacterium]|nr:hypothetical protein [Elusimicrobiota bacterium]
MGATWVGGGRLRMDWRKALAVLQRYQLPDPAAFLLPWARCAVLSGAAAIEAAADGSEVRLRFGGKPFLAEQFGDPFRAWAEGRDADGRLEQVLVGALGAFRLGPRAVEVRSGAPGERFRFSSAGPGKSGLVAEADGEGTVLSVAFPDGAWERPRECAARLREACALLDVPLAFRGLPEEPLAPEGLRLDWREEGRRGFVALPRRLDLPASEVALSQLGVQVAAVSRRLPFAQVDAGVNCDAFRLNVSRAGVLEGPELATALESVERQVESLLLEGCRRSGDILASAGEYGDWEPALRWLWAAAERAFSAGPGGLEHPVRRALWESRLFLGVSGKALSLKCLADQLPYVGCVPIAR